MIHGVSAHLLVAPQYHLWCVHPEDEAPEDEEEGSEDEDIDDAHASDDVEDNEELLGGIDEERSQSPSTLAGLVDPVPQSRATSQITDFAILEITLPNNTDASPESSNLGGIFTALSRGSALSSDQRDVLSSRRAGLPVDQHLPRVLVENKRFLSRQVVENNFFKQRLAARLREAQAQLLRQAAIAFFMPAPSVRALILIATCGPYYVTSPIRRKKKKKHKARLVLAQFMKRVTSHDSRSASRLNLQTFLLAAPVLCLRFLKQSQVSSAIDACAKVWPSSSGNGQSITMASFFQLLSGTLGLRFAESVFASYLAEKPAQARTGGANCDRERELDSVAEGAIAAIRRLFVSGHALRIAFLVTGGRADNELRSSLHLIKNIRIVKTLVPAAPAMVKTDTEKGAEAESP
ncbi:hypothetical protein B0H14DRAFT_3133522 [Mycena olivaceomarginata]|nr:hypothetical protein B0H14DRAFT_3133522 [Mycena olivaceomarginata]